MALFSLICSNTEKLTSPHPFLFAFKAIHSSVSTYNYMGSDAEPITLALRVKIDRLFLVLN